MLYNFAIGSISIREVVVSENVPRRASRFCWELAPLTLPMGRKFPSCLNLIQVQLEDALLGLEFDRQRGHHHHPTKTI